METQHNKYINPALLTFLADGGLVITANQRLSRYLDFHYGYWCQSQDRQAWPSPNIIPWQTWLESCWEQLMLVAADPLPCLLTVQQERQCWLDILQRDPVDEELLQTAALAQTAQQAWALWQQWSITEKELRDSGNAGTLRFLQWAHAFKSLCDKKHWLDSARLASYMTARVEKLLPHIPNAILLAGFDEITPDQQALIEVMRERDINVNHVDQISIESSLSRIGQTDARLELLAAAQWARQQYDSGVQHIAVIVPDLTQRRAEVSRIFDDALCPSAVLPGNSISERPYSISMGSPLDDVPLVRIALILCESIKQHPSSGLSYDHISAMLHTPYVAGADSEHSGRTALDIQLRNYNVVNASIWKLRAHASNFAEGKACPLLLAQLDKLVSYLDKLPRRQSAAAWAQSFVEILKCYGWPGRSLDSDEYQAYNHWDEVISELAALDGFTEKLTHSAAMNLLQRIAREKVFQTKSATPPIQVLGALESVGMCFDAIWVTGMTDEVWPPAANPNALLPVSVQRKYNLPHSSAEREYQFIHTVHERISRSANQVIFSWPLMDGDKQLAVSPFITGINSIENEADNVELSAYAQTIHHMAPTLEHELDVAIPLPAGEVARGGTGLIKQQSACPFSAFAFNRLNIRPLEEPEVGLDPRQRGSLIHNAMQAVWQHIKSHQQLCRLNDIAATIQPIIDTCVDDFMQQQAQQPPGRFMDLEKERLLNRIVLWLEGEKQRTAFIVTALEKKSRVQIGDLHISTQIDRIDETDQGLIAIDYKTGDTSVRRWLGDRPEEPQLPMYAQYDELMQNKPVAGVVFACLKKGAGKQFDGIVAEGITVPGAATADKHRSIREPEYKQFEAIRTHWQQTLSSLAAAYLKGDAAVDPRDANACMYCGLESLCRVYELDKRLEHNGRMDKESD